MPIPPRPPVDFAHWARQRFWKADEATALSYGRDPNTFWNDQYVRFSPNWGYTAARRDDFARALTDTMRPADCVAWAEKNDIQFPAPLLLELRKHENDVYYRVEELARELAALRAAQVASAATAEGPPHESGNVSPAPGERKGSPARDRAKKIIAELWADGVPSTAELRDNELYKAVADELNKRKFAAPSKATILRAAGRK